MIDAPINRGLRDLVQRGIDSRRFRHIDLESGVVLIMGIVVISLRHALEERVAQRNDHDAHDQHHSRLQVDVPETARVDATLY